MARSGLRGLGCALVATLAFGLPVATSVTANSAAASARHCPSERTVARALKKDHRTHLVRSHYNPKGVGGVKCTRNWVAAYAIYNFGGGENAYPVLERRKHGHWREVSRDKPCLQHKVPRKIYVYACNGS